MKKYRFKKHINEDTSVNNSQLIEIKYENPDSGVLKAMSDIVAADARRRAIKSGVLFEVKMSKSFMDSIEFPRVPKMMNALLQPTNMPRKYTDIHNSIDANPVKTIKEAEDSAKKYFSVGQTTNSEDVKPQKVDMKAIDQEGHNIPKTAPVEDEQPVDTITDNLQQNPIDTSISNSNNSVYYGLSKTLNEDLAGAASAGFAGGSFLTDVFGHIGAFGAGFSVGLLPALTGAYMLGGVGPKISSDHGNFYTDDRDILQHADLTTDAESKITSQKDLPGRIDSYLSALFNSIQEPLIHCTPKSATNDISDLFNTLAGLKAQTDEEIMSFIKNNDVHFKQVKERERNDKINRINSENEVLSDFNKLLLAAAKKGIKIEAATLKQLASSSEAGFIKRQKFIQDNALEESFNERYTDYKAINEANDDKSLTDVIFDADDIFDKAYHMIYTKMMKIFSHTDDIPRDVENARKMMESMRDGATKEITNKIAVVCRTANSDQLGLTSKLSAFITKHPMRSEYLTNLWKRHETDLNMRIERRIDAMTTLNGNGPLKMTQDFYMITIPNLVAMMVTYKCLIQLYLNKNCIDHKYISSLDENEINESATENIDKFPQAIAGVFSIRGHELNKESKPVYNIINNTLSDEPLDYLFPWIERILHNQITTNNLEAVNNYVQELQNAYTNKDVNKFFSGLTNIVIDSMKGINLNNIAEVFSDTFDKIDQRTRTDIDTVAAYLNDPEHKLVFKSSGADLTIKAILTVIYASKGKVLLNFEKNITKIEELNNICSMAGSGNILSGEQMKTISEYLDVEVTANEKEAASSLVNKTWSDKVRVIRDLFNGNITAQEIIKFYYTFELNRCTEIKEKTPYKIVKLFIDFLSIEVVKTLYNKAGAFSELQKIKNNYQYAVEDAMDYKEFLEILGGDVNAAVLSGAKNSNTHTVNNLGLTAIFGKASPDIKTYAIFMEECFNKILGSKTFNNDYFNNEEYTNNVKKNSSLQNVKSWEEVIKSLDTKTNSKTILMFLTSDMNGVSANPDGIRMFKDLLLYALGCAKIMFNHSDTAEHNFEKDIWSIPVVIGQKDNTTLAYKFYEVINQCIDRYTQLKDQNNTAGANAYMNAIKMVDTKLVNMFKSNNGYSLDSGILETLCSGNKFSKPEEMLNYIKDNIKLNNQACKELQGGVTDVLMFIETIFGGARTRDIQLLNNFLKLNYCTYDPSTGQINLNEIK